MSPNARSKPWVMIECGNLQGQRKRLFVYCWGMTCDDLPTTLNHLQACSHIDSIEKQRQLIEDIAGVLGRIPKLRQIDKNPLSHIPVDTFIRREDARATFTEMIQEAQKTRSELCVAGVANTMFFSGGAGVIQGELRAALEEGMKARFIFLDPDSDVARRREIYETINVVTREEIRSCIGLADEFRRDFPKQFKMRLAQDMPFFVCLNHRRGICQPYFITRMGQATVTWRIPDEVRNDFQKHFEKLWGPRWVLFDFGNVLVPFDHAEVSRQLQLSLPRHQRTVTNRNQIHELLFKRNPSSGYSANELIEKGADTDLRQICERFCKKFGVKISLARFQKAWCSIFGPPHKESFECIRKVRELGLEVGICSNTNAVHWEYICKKYKELGRPDIEHFLSFELGCRKPESLFFDKICNRTLRSHEEHVLIDDLNDNVAAAQRNHMKGITAAGPINFNNVRDFLELQHWCDVQIHPRRRNR